jgi:EAL domain-containing protein (putative c-di-GMP-specific phosphodiesterase class I)
MADGPARMSVNLSAKNLMERSLVDDVRRALDESGVPASALCLELTETSILADPRRTIDTLHRLAALGVTIAVDDFGTGQSSLSYLKRLPVGEIKIDRSFVIGMSTDPSDAAIVCSIIQLASNLGIPVVAEGVESDDVARQLGGFGCTTGQGFGFTRPLPEPQLRAWLRIRRNALNASGAVPTPSVPRG